MLITLLIINYYCYYNINIGTFNFLLVEKDKFRIVLNKRQLFGNCKKFLSQNQTKSNYNRNVIQGQVTKRNTLSDAGILDFIKHFKLKMCCTIIMV